jgi:hypothetical protein
MLPTFKPGEVLYLYPEVRAIEPGDIVVYNTGDGNVVHRVYSVTADGVMTRGDNNSSMDIWSIPFESILGVVECAEDWDETRHVTSGRRGLWRARVRWQWKSLVQRSLPLLGTPYRWLKASGWLARFWQPQVTFVRVNSAEAELVKYVVNGKTVAAFDLSSGHFTCRRPYDLIIFPPEHN